jgi:RimJ/RimL family protein N-acetyltransferase
VRLTTERLELEPLTVAAAEEMVAVLASPSLYRHTGGEPPDRATLARRYALQAAGWSPDRTQRWLNWIVRRRETGGAVGYVQATLVVASGATDVAWVVGAEYQGHGYAVEAARAMVGWLVSLEEVTRITAHISPENVASQSVARRLGFGATLEEEDGEVVWELQRSTRDEAASIS